MPALSVTNKLSVRKPSGLSANSAVATPGDVLFHIRAERMDLCFELATQIVRRLGGAVTVADEVHGFRYFDERDVIGFVDGTENPVGRAAARAVLIGAEDPGFAAAEQRAELARGLSTLPPRERSIVLLRFFEGLTQREIAERIGISQMHVSRLLRRSVESMRARLGA